MYKFLFLLFPILLLSQKNNIIKTETDSLYREDQIYASITYNLMQKTPTGFSQNGFSTGLCFGVMRDMPINKTRTWAIAAGLGYSYNNLKQNIKIEENNNEYIYSTADKFESNKLILHYAELPIELRWRNSDGVSYKFTRIYTGVKLSYLLNSKSSFVSENERITIKNNSSLSKLIIGPYLSVGYNSINLYAYYAFVPIAKNQKIGDNDLRVNSFNIGFQFYIL